MGQGHYALLLLRERRAMVDCRSADADNRRLSKECFWLGLIDGSRPRCSIGFAGGWEGFCLIGYVPDLSLGRGDEWVGRSGKKDKKDKTGRGWQSPLQWAPQANGCVFGGWRASIAVCLGFHSPHVLSGKVSRKWGF